METVLKFMLLRILLFLYRVINYILGILIIQKRINYTNQECGHVLFNDIKILSKLK
jgi:hypothetical protein